MGKRNDHVCNRCGKCCIDNGTIWVYSEHPVIKAMVKAVVENSSEEVQKGFFRDGGPCDMLVINENGQAVCLIQKWIGHKYKPESCQDYPFDEYDDGRCHYEIAQDNARMFGETDETEPAPSFSVTALGSEEDEG